MAGVDHAYQYSVEVKSRFSLFMDESLSNEDPDILLSKLQNERIERAKKDKSQVPTIVNTEKKIEKESEKQQVKTQPVPKAVSQEPENHAEVPDHQEKTAAPLQAAVRGRGGPRGYGRGFRGGRGYGPRGQHGDFSQGAFDSGTQRDSYEGRGRERFRPRGGFYRGRAANTDIRELPEQPENVSHDRQVNRNDESQPNWDDSHGEHEVSAGPAAETNGALASVENHEADNTEGKEEEKAAPTYTLQEYKAMRSQEKPAVTLASKGSRKANDGEDVFANMVAHRKIVEVPEDEFVKIETEEEQPNQIEINVFYNDDLGGGGRQNRGFGNRGFPRGGRSRGRPRMDRGGGRGTFRGDMRGRGAPRVIYNDQEFPSLK